MRRRRAAAALLAASAAPLAPPTKRRLNFINLTNGIEALPARDHSTQVCRIQSSRCEANDFYGVLQDLDHNLLFHLATGAECRVYDYGSRGTRWPGEVGAKNTKSHLVGPGVGPLCARGGGRYLILIHLLYEAITPRLYLGRNWDGLLLNQSTKN